jgi:hypothetical protein
VICLLRVRIMLCMMESEKCCFRSIQTVASMAKVLKFTTMVCHLSYVNMSFVIQFPDKERQVKHLLYRFQ